MPQPQFVEARAAFVSLSAQMRNEHIELRRGLLAILTPAQRSWIASRLGELAVAADPDAAGAASRIDAVLSPRQRQAVTQLAQVAAARAQAAMQQAFAQSQSEISRTLQVPGHSVIFQSGVATAGNVAGTLHASSFPPPRAFSAALTNQSAGTLIVEILTSGSLETLYPVPAFGLPKLRERSPSAGP